MSTPFASSYSFNPLLVGIDYVCDQAQFGLDKNDLDDHADLSSALVKFISHDIGRNTPFADPAGNVIGEVAAEWLVATCVDELACTSTLNFWLLVEWTNTKNSSLERFSSRLTTAFLELLRKRVEIKESISTGTIFAASNHLTTCLIFFEQTDTQREVMMNGLEALVNARGGFERLTDSEQPGLFQSLLWSDAIYSCFISSRPRFRIRAPPPMPHSLIPERTTTSATPSVYQKCCGPDLLDTGKYLRLFLLFRHGSETRQLSKAEYHYLVSLERFVHVQLLDQCARYHETDTLSECIVLSMGLVRMTVLCVWEQHVVARRLYTKRLDRALRSVGLHAWLIEDAALALVWVCWTILAQTEKCYDQDVIVDLLISGLSKTLGDDPNLWPEGWEAGFAEDYQPLLWHTDQKAFVPVITDLIREYTA